MPHQCTGCGHTFADGSKEMLSGCPECGGNKFQFRPDGESLPEDPPDAEPPSPDAGSPEAASASSVAETVGRATTRVRDFVASDPEEESGPGPDPNASWPGKWDDRVEAPDDAADAGEPADEEETDAADIIDADARRDGPVDEDEDVAQASARTDVVSEEELDGATLEGREAGAGADTGDSPEPPVESDGAVVSEPSGEEPDLAELREQLNDQFESIKIVEPGQYELNLMELYDREEYIIALQENGRYVIQVPEQWMGEEPGER